MSSVSPQTRAVVRLIVIIAGVAVAVLGLQKLAAVVLLLVFAALFAYVLAPLVHLAQRPIHIASQRHRLPRGAAIMLRRHRDTEPISHVDLQLSAIRRGTARSRVHWYQLS